MNRAGRAMTVIACAAMPPLLLCLVAWAQGCYPFGSASFLSSDLAQQYVDLYAWFRRVLTGQGNILYSWGISLGSNMWGNFSYYLSSPLNLLLPLFPADKITLFVFVTDAIKLSLIQLSMCWYLRARFGLSGLGGFVLSLGFTFSTWTISMLRNPMWLDAVYLLPIAMYGCWQLIHEGRWGLLLASLAADIMICWYMAYMSIVFLCMFVLLEAYLMHADHPELDSRWLLRRALCFCSVLGCALLLSAWTFVPTVVQMLGTENAGGTATNVTLSQLVAGLFPGTLQTDHVPQLFFGSLTLLLGVGYFFNGRIELRRRIAPLVVLGLLALACVVVPLGVVFTGFRLPDGFCCRYAWLFGVVLLWCAAAELVDLRGEEITPRELVFSLVALSCAVAYVAYKGLFTRWRYAALSEFSLVAFALTIAVICTPRHMRFRNAVRGLCCALVFAELALSARLSWLRTYNDGLSQAANDAYVAHATADLARLRELDSGAYRVDKTFTRWGNAYDEGLAQGYAALSGYTSVNNGRLFGLLDTLGVTGTPSHYLTRYICPVPTTDSLFGLRYVFSVDCPPGYETTSVTDGGYGYQVFRNPNALSLGYGVSGDISQLALDAGDARDPFANQNLLLAAMLEHEVHVWKQVSVVPEETGKTDSLRWTVSSDDAASTYFYLTNNPDNVTLSVSLHNGDQVYNEFDFSRHGIYVLGGGEQEVTATSLRGSIDGLTLVAYELDLDELDTVMSELAEHQLQVTEFEDGHLAGTYEAASAGTLLTTVPYDEGWTVLVNGQQVDYEAMVDGALIAIPVQAGANEIELRFVPRGLKAGCVLTALSGVGLLGLTRVRRRQEQRRRQGR